MRRPSAAACLVAMLSAAPLFAQAPAPTQTPAPAQTPPTPAPSPPAPFPQGAKVAYVNLQAIAQLSAEGKAATSKVNDFATKKQAEIAEREKTLLAADQKLAASAAVLSDEARAQLEKDIERQRRELERLRQDAQTDLTDLQADLQAEFNKKLFPILDQMSVEKGLHFLFSAADAGLIWAAQGLDLTEEAVKRLDATTSAPKP